MQVRSCHPRVPLLGKNSSLRWPGGLTSSLPYCLPTSLALYHSSCSAGFGHALQPLCSSFKVLSTPAPGPLHHIPLFLNTLLRHLPGSFSLISFRFQPSNCYPYHNQGFPGPFHMKYKTPPGPFHINSNHRPVAPLLSTCLSLMHEWVYHLLRFISSPSEPILPLKCVHECLVFTAASQQLRMSSQHTVGLIMPAWKKQINYTAEALST